ncbi:DUF3349 domain-containing protein [Mycolicibacterium sphagni]|uniref:Uncharacterized protein n=1 Tax=Mycolicibacterium sphagni TaxID=1786 RepID=A0A255DHW9_9MYCO|nr:DUF3349 domain-containing protein [Mycolicibacterium sphagni]MCV7178090.1 DUF3349 domain-containing protein [Mycolicibacterium sphagni]OYN76542.1 hypothetical protein CG716_21900 [Mycolicibacterium sphagni]
MFRSPIVAHVAKALGLRSSAGAQPRCLSEDDAAAVAYGLTRSSAGAINGIDIRVQISMITGELPTPSEVRRVKHLLTAADWLVADQFDSPEG